jgi:hypothetical protein
VFQLSPNEKKIYVMTGNIWVPNSTGRGDRSSDIHALYEWDITAGQITLLCRLPVLDDIFVEPGASSGHFYNTQVGSETWDRNGCFYQVHFYNNSASFPNYAPGENVILTGIDIVRVKVALGLLPSLTEVSCVRDGASGVRIERTGATEQALEVLVDVTGYNSGVLTGEKTRMAATIAAASQSLTLQTASLLSTGLEQSDSVAVDIVPDGDTYVAGALRETGFPTGAVAAARTVGIRVPGAVLHVRATPDRGVVIACDVNSREGTASPVAVFHDAWGRSALRVPLQSAGNGSMQAAVAPGLLAPGWYSVHAGLLSSKIIIGR